MFSSFHVFKDQELLDRVRQDIQEYLGDQSIHEADPITLVKAIPLLSSVYAETLRLYIKVYSLYRSPHEDVPLGKWILPKGALAVLNSGPSHMDADFWNTKDGEHPVECFWSKRFLIDPSDARSGPVRPELRKPTNEKAVVDKKPYYSTEGCDGAWIPYGGTSTFLSRENVDQFAQRIEWFLMLTCLQADTPCARDAFSQETSSSSPQLCSLPTTTL